MRETFEMVGLLLALGAWSWDLHVHTLLRYKDGYERQLMHMIDSYHNYANRDLLAIEALTVQVTLEKPSLARGEIFETLSESSPAFKESGS